MNYAILYNVFVCWIVAMMGWATTRALFRRPKPSLAWQSLALTWNFIALLWFLAGLRLLSYFVYVWTGHRKAIFLTLDRTIFYADEVCLAIQVVFGIVFAVEATFERRLVTLIVATASGLIAGLFLTLLFAIGINPEQLVDTPWGSEYRIPLAAFYAFLPVYFLSLILFFCTIIKGLWAHARAVAGPDRGTIVAAAALALYALAGVVDVRGTLGGWQLLGIRLNYLIAALMTFLVARPEDRSIRLVRRRRSD